MNTKNKNVILDLNEEREKVLKIINALFSVFPKKDRRIGKLKRKIIKGFLHYDTVVYEGWNLSSKLTPLSTSNIRVVVDNNGIAALEVLLWLLSNLKLEDETERFIGSAITGNSNIMDDLKFSILRNGKPINQPADNNEEPETEEVKEEAVEPDETKTESEDTKSKTEEPETEEVKEEAVEPDETKTESEDTKSKTEEVKEEVKQTLFKKVGKDQVEVVQPLLNKPATIHLASMLRQIIA